MNKTHRVYDNRTNETLFEGYSGIACGAWIDDNVPEDNKDFERVWIERIKKEVKTDE